ncbi:MAG: hypothetical protein ACE5GA_05260 [Candidatus Zixiibacteriota bacterium]
MTRFRIPRVARCCEGAQRKSRAGHKKAHPVILIGIKSNTVTRKPPQGGFLCNTIRPEWAGAILVEFAPDSKPAG